MSSNTLNAELNPIWHLLALLGTHHILHVSWIKVVTKSCKIRIVFYEEGKKFDEDKFS